MGTEAISTKRKYGKLPRAAILEMVRSGRLVVDTRNAIVHSVTRYGNRRLRVYESMRNGKSRAYLHVRIYSGKRRSAVMLHVIVWMAAHNQLVPDGHQIDHDDEDNRNNADSNLVCRPTAEHAAKHGKSYPSDWDDEEESF